MQDTTVELQTKVFEDYAKLYTAATLALLTLRSLQGSIDVFDKLVCGATNFQFGKCGKEIFHALMCQCQLSNACEWLYQLWAAAVRHCANVKS